MVAFGGYSYAFWREPIWFPVNILILSPLLQFCQYYGNEFAVECPTGSGHKLNLFQAAKKLPTVSVASFYGLKMVVAL